MNIYSDNFITENVSKILSSTYSPKITYYKMIGLTDGCNGIIQNWIKNNYDLDCELLAQILYDNCVPNLKNNH